MPLESGCDRGKSGNTATMLTTCTHAGYTDCLLSAAYYWLFVAGSVLLLAQRAAHGAWEVVAEARPPPRGAGEEECAVVGLACLQVSPNTSALYVASASGGVFCWSPDEVTA